jgi:hypothetical protein
MRSCRASITANEISNVTARRAGLEDAIGDRLPPASFGAALSAAEQIVVDGLAEMWAARQAAGRPDRRALLASLTTRANVLTLRTTIEAARIGSARATIRDLVACKMRAAGSVPESTAGAA